MALPRSLRSRRSVKDVPEQCVKDVMELNTPSAVPASAVRRVSFVYERPELRPANSRERLPLRELFLHDFTFGD